MRIRQGSCWVWAVCVHCAPWACRRVAHERGSAFMAVGRVREFLADGMPTDTAVESVAANAFHHHTPVSAGNRLSCCPCSTAISAQCERHGMDFHRLLELGTLTEKNGYKFFSSRRW